MTETESADRYIKPKRNLFFPIVVLTLAIAMLIAGGWFTLSLTETHSGLAESDQNAEPPTETSFFTPRTKQLITAYTTRKELLLMEKEIRKKHNKKDERRFEDSAPDREDIYRSWRKMKEQTERHYANFKDDVTDDPNSVKLQMEAKLKSLEEDRPPR